MKFVCVSCKKTFMHPAKETIVLEVREQASTSPIQVTPLPTKTVETYVCPYCGAEYDELPVDVTATPRMIDWVKCDDDQVKEYLDKGYVVLTHHTKQIRLCKYADTE